MINKKQLMEEIIKEALAYHSSVLSFGEEASRRKKWREKMAQLSPKERRSVKEEIGRRKFLIVKNLFESFYR